MGAGKTTVVAPLLCMILLGEGQLVAQVMPAELLEFSRSVLRERFSAVLRKPVYTFNFDRYQTVTDVCRPEFSEQGSRISSLSLSPSFCCVGSLSQSVESPRDSVRDCQHANFRECSVHQIL